MHDPGNHSESHSQPFSTTTGLQRFLRQVEVDNWQFAWAEEQKVACCKTVGRGTQLQHVATLLVSVCFGQC